jgi:sec-independent protein translocase protein TatC
MKPKKMIQNKTAPFWDHIEAFRRALIRSGSSILLATLAAFCFHKEILAFLIAPLIVERLYLLSPLEGFFCATKLSFWTGIILSSPCWLYFFLTFLLPALKPREKRALFPFLLLSFLLILGGALFAYRITLPLVFRFFQKFNAGMGENLWSLSQTLNLILKLSLAHAIIFELYVVLLFLIKFGYLRFALLKQARKGVIVAFFVLAALLTPPDVLSQLLLALPMWLLFESALFYARIMHKKYLRVLEKQNSL